MIKYIVFRQNAENCEQTRRNTYGICACAVDEDTVEIVDRVKGISDNRACVRELTNKLNRYEVEAVHLYDVIVDELYAQTES